MNIEMDKARKNAFSSEKIKGTKDLYEEVCACPTCGSRFSPDEIDGGYLDRKCPICSSPITLDLYDELAKEILKERKTPREQLEALSADMRNVNRALDMTKPREIYTLTGLRERKASISAQMDVLGSEISRLNRKLEDIAVDRYYSSEWYLRTHIDLDHQTARAKLNIKPHYSAKGTWCFKCNNAAEAGFAAELYIAELLFQRANDPASPLFKAQIFPNIYIPRKRNHKRASLWVQIDCLVITRFCIFVLEIKRHSRHILIPSNSSYESIYSSRKRSIPVENLPDLSQIDKTHLERLGLSDRESESINQNEFHADTLKQLCPMFDPKSIFRQIVYVKPSSFTSHTYGFIDGICVDYAYYDEPHFMETIEAQCMEMAAMYSQQQIDDVAEKIITPNCDLEHQRELLHKMMSKPREKKRRSKGRKRC